MGMQTAGSSDFRMIEGCDGVALHDFKQTGRGLKALRRFAKGEQILSAPSSILWTVSAACEEPHLGGILKGLSAGLSVDDTISVHLLFVKHSPKYEGGSSSLRRRHIELIPSMYSSSVTFEDEELELCRGSSVYELTVRLKDQIEDDYRSLLTGLFIIHPETFPLSRFTLKEYTWALLTVWSRAMDFQVPATNGSPPFSLRCIVPFVDMVNHSSDVIQCHIFDQASGCVKILSGGKVNKGDQIFINYGPVGNSRLLRLYGFVIPDNPNDSYDLVLSTHPLAPSFHQKVGLFVQANLTTDSSAAVATFPLSRSDPLPPALLQYLRIQRLSDEEIEAGVPSLAAVKVTTRNEREVLMALGDAFEGILAGFSPNLESLRKRLGAGEWKVGVNSWAAAVVSISEQTIITGALDRVKALLALTECAGCSQVVEGLKLCSKCKKVTYCKAECQKLHHKLHKKHCTV
ncbi:hypothetical protein HDU67_008385 [Dinochytrium kinnereticum]|nr:hypothetical protein HDU67_008385 [Dinochytrium kinnereticum]